MLKYACPVWYLSLNSKLSSQLENIQKGVFKIILPTHTYTQTLEHSGAPTLKDRRSEITKSFFVKMKDQNHKLYHMLPSVQTQATTLAKHPGTPPKMSHQTLQK